MGIAYTFKQKHKCSVLPLLIWRIQIWDSVAMLFLLIAFFSLESDCKNTKLFRYSKKKEISAKEIPAEAT